MRVQGHLLDWVTAMTEAAGTAAQRTATMAYDNACNLLSETTGERVGNLLRGQKDPGTKDTTPVPLPEMLAALAA